MFLHIERGSSTPISRQIAEQIAALCAAESLRVGDRLPSVRQLAQELTVNQNTVLRVYTQLSADGLLEMRHGEGTFVAGNASRRRFEKQRRQLIDELGLIVRRGLMLGISPEEVRQLCDEALETNAALGTAESVGSSPAGG
ncbi:MAG TPA: GntR family transcriptional regulator [Pirellulaceae bacterium]|nr:GntR family transcriptional regulator [Pirellulaceae bacterium]